MRRPLLCAAVACLLSPLPALGQAPAFEAASVKRNLSNDREVTVLYQPGGFRAVNETLYELIRIAHVTQAFRIIGAPDWTKAERYDVAGRAAAGNVSRERLAAMLRTLLIERFGMAARPEVRELPVYALVAARDDRRLGDGLRPASAAACRPPAPGVPSWEPGQLPRCGALLENPGWLQGRSITLAQLVPILSERAERVVVDHTGLAGPFDLDLQWAPGLADGGAAGLFTALQEQLGLRLDSRRGPVDVVVVERIERPQAD